jgi:hypothetical protein
MDAARANSWMSKPADVRRSLSNLPSSANQVLSFMGSMSFFAKHRHGARDFSHFYTNQSQYQAKIQQN